MPVCREYHASGGASFSVTGISRRNQSSVWHHTEDSLSHKHRRMRPVFFCRAAHTLRQGGIAVRKEWYKAAAVLAVCAAMASAARAVRGSELGQHLPSLALGQTAQTVGSSICDGEFSEVTAVFSHALFSESDTVSVSAPSVPEDSDEED